MFETLEYLNTVQAIPLWLILALTQLGGGIVNAATSQGQINRMNRYNDPRAQLQRLNAAGLPFAAFSQGQAGSQSNLPDMSGIGEGIKNTGILYLQNQMQKKQIEMLNEQIETAKATTRKTWAEARTAHAVARETDERVNENLSEFGFPRITPPSNLAWLMEQDREVKSLDTDMKKYDRDMKEIDSLFKSDQYKSGRMVKLVQAEIDNLLAKLDITKQLYNNNEKATIARNELIARMEKGGLSFGEALIIQVMNALTGGLKTLGN